MYQHNDNPHIVKQRSVADDSQPKIGDNPLQLIETSEYQKIADNSSRVKQLKAFQTTADNSPRVKQLKTFGGQQQLNASAKLTIAQNTAPIQMAPTSMPDISDPERKKYENLSLTLATSQKFNTKLGENAAEAFGKYLKLTPDDDLPPILREIKGILEQLETGEKRIPEDWQHVPLPQLAAIIGYSTTGYLINEDLRTKEPTTVKYDNLYKNYTQILNIVIGLDRHPAHVGWVYRGNTATPDEFETNYKQNRKVVFSSFMSATKSATISSQFKSENVKKVKMILTMYSKSGRDITEIARDPSEQEVLFAPGTEFTVDSIKEGNGLYEVVVIESGPGDLNAPVPDRIAELAKEKEASKLAQEASGPTSYEMITKLLMKGIDISPDVTPEVLKAMYDKEILKK